MDGLVVQEERVKNLDREAEGEYRRIGTLNNTSFQRTRAELGLKRMRIHDIRHTFGQPLRDAGVSDEDRVLLLGHAIKGIPQHHVSATVAGLVQAANKVQQLPRLG